jgi:integrase
MASITINRKNGRKTVQFVGPDGARRSLRLGKVPIEAARTAKIRVEAIVSAALRRVSVDSETAEWIGGLDDTTYGRLVGVHLAEPRTTEAPTPEPGTDPVQTLKTLIDEFGKSKLKAKQSTRVHWGHTWRNLVGFFGESKDIATITEADAGTWAEWLDVEQALSLPTIRKRCGNAKQLFAFAGRKRLLPSNPFAWVKSANVTNRTRDYFLKREDAALITDECPDAEWRLLFALSRYGGLRCPSEHLSLRWDAIDWQRARMRVRSPKTEHHQGGESRMVPIFPELLPFLEDALELAEPGAEYVITRYRDAKQNLRTQFERIVKRAGLDPWPKLWHNLRASRQTELEESFPSHVVCAWLGNSETVAKRHYLQVTDAHFEKAVQKAVHQNDPRQETDASGEEFEPSDGEQPEIVAGFTSKSDPKCRNNAYFPDTPKWAMRDSNPRHLRCKRSALTN